MDEQNERICLLFDIRPNHENVKLHSCIECTEKIITLIGAITIYIVAVKFFQLNILSFIILIIANVTVVGMYSHFVLKVVFTIMMVSIFNMKEKNQSQPEKQPEKQWWKLFLSVLLTTVLFIITVTLPIYLGTKLAPSDPIKFCQIKDLPPELQTKCNPTSK